VGLAGVDLVEGFFQGRRELVLNRKKAVNGWLDGRSDKYMDEKSSVLMYGWIDSDFEVMRAERSRDLIDSRHKK
jgi:hypothetical protein